MFSLGRPCNEFKIKWIEFSCSSKGGKTFSPDEILEYCKYQQEKRPLFPIRSRSKGPSPLHREPRITNHQLRVFLTAGRWTWQVARERQARSAAGIQRELARGRP
jgi:hypothetical protein